MQDATPRQATPLAAQDAPGHATTPQAGTSRYATVKEAAELLGVSTETIRRMIRGGKLQAERVVRPQGTAFVVLLDDATVVTSQDAAGDVRLGRHDATSTPPTSPALLVAEAWARGVVEPLTRVIDEQRRDLDAKSERIGYLSAELEQARARLAELEAPAESERVVELEREAGTLAERMAGLERVRDAAMAHASELQQRLDATATRPPEPAPDPFPRPIPPTPNVGPRRCEPRWRRWVRRVVLGA